MLHVEDYVSIVVQMWQLRYPGVVSISIRELYLYGGIQGWINYLGPGVWDLSEGH